MIISPPIPLRASSESVGQSMLPHNRLEKCLETPADRRSYIQRTPVPHATPGTPGGRAGVIESQTWHCSVSLEQPVHNIVSVEALPEHLLATRRVSRIRPASSAQSDVLLPHTPPYDSRRVQNQSGTISIGKHSNGCLVRSKPSSMTPSHTLARCALFENLPSHRCTKHERHTRCPATEGNHQCSEKH